MDFIVITCMKFSILIIFVIIICQIAIYYKILSESKKERNKFDNMDFNEKENDDEPIRKL